MAQVSKYPLSDKVYQRIFEVLFQAATKIKNKKEAEEFFNDILTPTEKIMLAKRISIALLLVKKYDYRAIRKILHVSPSTIASVSVSLRYTGKGYKQVVEKLLKEEAIKDFLLRIAEGIASLGSVGGKGSGDWRQLKIAIQKNRREKQF